MASNYCLDRNELELFLENVLYDKDISNSHLKAIIENSQNWQVEAIGLVYFLGRIVQRKINNGILKPDYIENVYALTESMFFDLNDFGIDFINFLLHHDRLIDSDYKLDEILNLLHASYTDKDYGRIIRS
jgi:hypothetical protein